MHMDRSTTLHKQRLVPVLALLLLACAAVQAQRLAHRLGEH